VSLGAASNIFASVANFLQQHGWQAGAGVLVEVRLVDGSAATPSGHVSLDETIAGLKARGVEFSADLPGATPAVLLEVQMKDSASYLVGLPNFYVLTRYNPPVNYVLAVNALAEALRGLPPSER
jgi:membrane-bound lytic murein transglycosylase B